MKLEGIALLFTVLALAVTAILFSFVADEPDITGKVIDESVSKTVEQMGKSTCEATNNWCEGRDIDQNGKIDITDLIYVIRRSE